MVTMAMRKRGAYKRALLEREQEKERRRIEEVGKLCKVEVE